jgi:chromosome segregation ATPase
MIDIFNKKKIKRMETTNDTLHNQIELLKTELNSKQREIEYFEQEEKRNYKIENDLINENAKLIDWIQGILKVAKVYETKNTLDVITIPIQKNIKSKLDGLERPYTQTDVIIPSIHFSVSNVDYDIDSTWIR